MTGMETRVSSVRLAMTEEGALFALSFAMMRKEIQVFFPQLVMTGKKTYGRQSVYVSLLGTLLL